MVWNLRIESAVTAPDDSGEVHVTVPGPRVPPGRYTVTVRAGAETRSAEVLVLADPRIFSDDAALEAQYRLLVAIRDRLDEIGRAVAWIHAQPGTDRLAALESALVGRAGGHSDALKNAPGLAAKIVLLPEIVVELSDTAPTEAVTHRLAAAAGPAGHAARRTAHARIT